MQHILNDVLGSLTEDITKEMGAKVGLNVAQTRSILQQAVPSIFGGLAKNTKDEAGAASLLGALKKDHDGSILDQAKDLIADPEKFAASKILGHVLGNKENAVAQFIGKNVGADSSAVSGLMKMAAPLIMGQLGKSLKKYGLNVSDLQKLLSLAKKDGKKGGHAQKLAMSFLDKDGDGDIKDDLLVIGQRWLQKKMKNRA